MRRNRSWGETDLSDGICAILAIRLHSGFVGPILLLAANGRFAALISCDPLAVFGGVEPVASVATANAYSRRLSAGRQRQRPGG
jgi:hypothetical protein